VSDVRDLARYLESGCKPPSAYKIGTEHEAFGFFRDGFGPPAYRPEGRPGIEQLLLAAQAEGLTPILDSGNIIGLKGGGASLSLEPGGQFELSGAMLGSVHETKAELEAHVARIHRIATKLGLGFAPLGFHPKARREDMPFMPKGRYRIMRDYMPKVGALGLDMMLRTCTVQVNLDFCSEADMVTKLRVGYCLQPLATAMFANSPFYEGKPNGYLSNRALVWTDTDNARSGIPEMVFLEGFGFEAYANWLADVPMYFVYRDGKFVDVAGASFRDFLAGKLAALPGERATIGDFADHATTAFPDVRLKRYIETRGADSGAPAMMLAQSAFWTGIFYDAGALAAAEHLVRGICYEELLSLRAQVPRLGLETPFREGSLRDLARDAVRLAEQGLRARGLKNAAGEDERIYLAPLHEIAAGGPTQAERWLEKFSGEWGGDVTRIFGEAAL